MSVRTDTQLIPVPGLRPLPARLSPRATGPAVLAVAVHALLAFVVVLVAVAVCAAVVVAGALLVSPSLLLAGAAALALAYPVLTYPRRAR